MNTAEQKRYLKECMHRLAAATRNFRYGSPDIEDAPPSVQAARKQVALAQRVVDRWRARENRKRETQGKVRYAELEAFRRSFAFSKPADTLKMWDKLLKKYPELNNK